MWKKVDNINRIDIYIIIIIKLILIIIIMVKVGNSLFSNIYYSENWQKTKNINFFNGLLKNRIYNLLI